jgi:hypothetical protein
MRFCARAVKVVGLAIIGLTLLAGCASASTPNAGSTATPTAQPRAGMTCMPKPSACGFPDVTNTGPVPGTPLTSASGVVTLDRNGEVYENKVLTGSLIVTAQNVVIRNVRLINTDPNYAISVKNNDDWDNDEANLLLDHVEVNLNGHSDIKGIAFNGYTARNVFFHNGSDCAHFGQNVVIEDSLCVLGPDTNGDGQPDGSTSSFCDGTDHFDGFQSDGGRNITLRRNTIRNPCGQTAAILMSTNTSPIDNVVVDRNLMSGGGYTVYCGTSSGGVTTRMTYTNNVISREFFPRGGYWGPTTECNRVDVSGGNVWDGNYVPPPGVGGGGPAAPGGAVPAPGAQGVSYFLSRADARRLTRVALRRELKRRYTRRAKKGSRLRCSRRSRSTIACRVQWRNRAGRRYRGTVTIRRTAARTFRYSLRVRGGSQRFREAGRIRPSRRAA